MEDVLSLLNKTDLESILSKMNLFGGRARRDHDVKKLVDSFSDVNQLFHVMSHAALRKVLWLKNGGNPRLADGRYIKNGLDKKNLIKEILNYYN